jgi:hypothetical protein
MKESPPKSSKFWPGLAGMKVFLAGIGRDEKTPKHRRSVGKSENLAIWPGLAGINPNLYAQIDPCFEGG